MAVRHDLQPFYIARSNIDLTRLGTAPGEFLQSQTGIKGFQLGPIHKPIRNEATSGARKIEWLQGRDNTLKSLKHKAEKYKKQAMQGRERGERPNKRAMKWIGRLRKIEAARVGVTSRKQKLENKQQKMDSDARNAATVDKASLDAKNTEVEWLRLHPGRTKLDFHLDSTDYDQETRYWLRLRQGGSTPPPPKSLEEKYYRARHSAGTAADRFKRKGEGTALLNRLLY